MLALATRAGTTRVDSYVDFASASVMTGSLFTRLKMEETERVRALAEPFDPHGMQAVNVVR